MIKKKFAKDWLVNSGAGMLYMFGLSLLIPLTAYVLFPYRVISLVFVMTVVLAALCMLVSYRWLRWYHRRRGKALFIMSFSTLGPVILAVVLSFFPVEVLFASLRVFVPDVESVRPLVESYLEHKVPRVVYVLVIYAFVGAALLWRAMKKR